MDSHDTPPGLKPHKRRKMSSTIHEEASISPTMKMMLEMPMFSTTVASFLAKENLTNFLQVLDEGSEQWESIQHPSFWTTLLDRDFGGPPDGDRLHAVEMYADEAWYPTHLTVPEVAWYIHSASNWKRFNESIYLLQEDAATITEIDGVPIEAMAFPTTPFLQQPNIGVGAIVFHRAGKELRRSLRASGAGPIGFGTAVVTPGFRTGFQRLILCHGPHGSDPDCAELLQETYEGVLGAVEQSGFQCVAIISISTGNLGVSGAVAGPVAMRALLEYIVLHPGWLGKIGVICWEDEVLEEFRRAKEDRLKALNAV